MGSYACDPGTRNSTSDLGRRTTDSSLGPQRGIFWLCAKVQDLIPVRFEVHIASAGTSAGAEREIN